MWVADMDFATAPAITEAIQARAKCGAYGYNVVPDTWKDAIIDWWERRHQVRFAREWIVFSTGVVPSLSSIVRKMTTPGENVLIMTPVYNIFYNSILNNGRHVLECPLVYEAGRYHIDFTALEKCMANPQTTLMILCNPQNPSGNIWDKVTLAHIGALAKEHDVLVVSDEIHCDLVDPGYAYCPYASASEECLMNSVTLVSATKAFNIAGLQTSAVIAANPLILHKVNRGLNTDEVAEPNTFAITAATAAFNEGEEWLTQLCAYLAHNKQVLAEFVAKELPQMKLVVSHATYLMWFDCSAITSDTRALAKHIRRTTGLFLTAGKAYGGNGKAFVRINVACPECMLLDACERLKRGVQSFANE
jgi:cystathionine beta-lyase